MDGERESDRKDLVRVTAVGAGGHGKNSRAGSVLRTVIPPAGALVLLLGLWLFVTYVVLSPGRRFLVPPPQEVFADSFLRWSHLKPLLAALKVTAGVALTGLVIAAVTGFLVAVLMSQADWAARAIYPYAVALQTVPILAIVPLIGLWFGYSFSSRVVVCTLIALFPMIANTLFGLRSASQEAHDLFTLNKATRWQRLTRLQIPAALPSICLGLRISSGLSVIGAIVGDFFFTQGAPGIGTLLDLYRATLQFADLFAAIILSALFGIAVFLVFTGLGGLVAYRRR
ncbi:ABC transporter permease [Kitasatospora sp. NPDC048540]|uniref:ABC transporter permease n=1 Tax=unclassified Kitasatospora TaxID=2633591 RepID=UPI0009EB52D3|nr:ABC transporter permease [Kitasatospora sp. MBT63]